LEMKKVKNGSDQVKACSEREEVCLSGTEGRNREQLTR